MPEITAMNFDRLFNLLSYAAVLCGFSALFLAGAFGPVGAALFAGILIVSWFLNGTRWQISERVGTALIVMALPAYFAAYKFGIFSFTDSETMVAGILARLILTLTAIKLLQKRSDRDWIFLYLMAFFQVLLAAGLSISALYLVSFIVYILVMACTVILFEIRKTNALIGRRLVEGREGSPRQRLEQFPKRRLPAASLVLIVLIALAALPMFFLLPRVGGAGFGGQAGGVSASSGFSDTVRLGGIRTIQQNEQVVMRVRVEEREELPPGFKWRGLALDRFDGQAWSKTVNSKEPRAKGDRELIQVDFATGRDSLLIQTIYLEPLDIPVLFALPRVVGIQGEFPYLYRDPYGAITAPRSGSRVSYRALSDIDLPSPAALRSDSAEYTDEVSNYLQLPADLDPRLAELTKQIASNSDNRYQTAAAVESYLQTQFGYTLEPRAGGDDPLADFLFNVREGHCEYFATAMAIMLRTQGIATRIVNGFQQGEYNGTADVFVIRQLNAHSWVEVYFPGKDVWVPFDPTPIAGQNLTDGTSGIAQQFNKYVEALEMFWIQYFVAFDSQEQRSLFTSIRREMSDYGSAASSWSSELRDAAAAWWRQLRGDEGLKRSFAAFGWGLGYLAAAAACILLVMMLIRKIVKLEVWRKLRNRFFRSGHIAVVEFYDRMLKVLESKGIAREKHQTPLEFAFATGISESVKITEMYNKVRFGGKALSDREADEIEEWLAQLVREPDKN